MTGQVLALDIEWSTFGTLASLGGGTGSDDSCTTLDVARRDVIVTGFCARGGEDHDSWPLFLLGVVSSDSHNGDVFVYFLTGDSAVDPLTSLIETSAVVVPQTSLTSL